jgi:hypothetical protein
MEGIASAKVLWLESWHDPGAARIPAWPDHRKQESRLAFFSQHLEAADSHGPLRSAFGKLTLLPKQRG